MKKYTPLAFFLGALLFAASTYLYSQVRIDPETSFRHDIATYAEGSEIPKPVFEKYYDSLGPKIMLDIIDERPACHLEGHNLGTLIFERTQDLPRATLMCKTQCYEGCMHGALLGFVQEERKETGVTGDPQPDDLTPNLVKTITGLCESESVLRFMPLGSCYHALGHVFAYFTDSDLPQTLKLCRQLAPRGEGAVYQCAVGLYMQRSSDYAQVDMKVDTTGWYPCNTGDYPAACYRYRIPLLYGSSTPIVRIARDCNDMQEPDRGACFHGLGISAFMTAYKDPEKINTICNTGDRAAQRMCLDGVIGRLTSFGIDAGKQICGVYNKMSVAECLKSVPSIYNMDRDYSAYAVPRSR